MQELIRNAQKYAHRIAIISNGKKYTYQELLEVSAKIASKLLADKNDLAETRVAFMVEPGFDYTAVQWGIWRAGGIAVPLCVSHPLPSLKYVLEDTGAAFLIVSEKFVDLLKPFSIAKGLRFFRVNECAVSGITNLPEVALSRPSMILYTSGTTNLPKGVVSTHANIEAQITTLVEAWEWQKEDHILCILPLHHVHGIINVMSCALWSGACCEFLPKFTVEGVFNAFNQGQINLFMAVPTIYYKLIQYWEQLDQELQQPISKALQRFRLMVSGSAALPISVLEKWRKISGQTLLERYGMTEIGMGLSNPYRGKRMPGKVGQPLPKVELRLVNEQGVEVPEGEQGEIHIKGPSVFKEYWNKPQATRDAFAAGWFKTGDIAVLENGSYRILGRNSVDIIKSGGYKISALEIEEVLRKYPLIKDCGVVGLPSEEWGETVGAGLVVIAQINLQELNIWLKERLPTYKIPRQFITLDDLPRNTLGKVTKKELKQLF